MPRRAIAPTALVMATVLIIWFVSGVSVSDVVKFLGYELAFVLLPGAALLWALRRQRPGALLTVALGWPLGQTLEILAFSATVAIGTRVLFVAYPIVVVAPCALLISRRSRATADDTDSPLMSGRVMWIAAGALSLGVIYIALAYLPSVPLPSLTQSVSYYPDFAHFIGLTAEAKNHWPATSPGLAGFPLHYEWFVFDHMAAISQVTGVGIPLLGFRLDFIPSILVVGCQLLVVGRLVGRSTSTGVVAIVVMFLLGPLDLTKDLGAATPFFDQFHFDLTASWTLLFGMTFLLALLYLLVERLLERTWRTSDALRAWVVIALIMIGASGAKATILPVVITGTGLYGLWELWSRRAAPMTALVTVALGIVIFVATFLIVYGGGVPGTQIHLLTPLSHTVAGTLASHISSHAVRVASRFLGYFIAIPAMFLPLAGILYLFRRRHRAEFSRFALCLCLFISGFVIANLVHQVGDSELYFLDTGYVAATVVAAQGLRLAWLDLGEDIPISARVAALAFLAWAALVAAAVVVTSPTLAHPATLLFGYAVLAAAVVAFAAIARSVTRSQAPSAAGLAALALIPLLAVSALTVPIQLAPTVKRVLTGQPITVTQPDPATVRGLTPGLVSALDWLREHTSVNTVIAVSNHWIDPAGTGGRYYYYSAFSERRVFVEAYDPLFYGLNNPPLTLAFVSFLHRVMLNDAVFDDANASALRVLTEKYGVRFLLIDRIHHNADPALLLQGNVVFSDPDATILAVG